MRKIDECRRCGRSREVDTLFADGGQAGRQAAKPR